MHARPILRSRLTAVMCICLGFALAGCTGRLGPTTRPTLTSPGEPRAGVDDPASAQAGAARAAAQPGYYPLRVGNRWVHRFTATYRLIPNVGDAPPVETFEYLVHRRILPPLEQGGGIYLPEEVQTAGPSGTWSYVVLYRQDISGLYEFSAIRAAETAASATGASEDVATSASLGTHPEAIERLIASRPPAERAALVAAAGRLTQRIAALGMPGRTGPGAPSRVRWPGTEGPYELTRLRYPLEPKTGWVIEQGFGAPLLAEVVGLESLELGPGTLRGHRIRLVGGFLGPVDSSEIWFGPSGYLMSVAHVEADATDPNGNLIGRWTYDQRETLLDLRLVSASFVEPPPWFDRHAK